MCICSCTNSSSTNWCGYFVLQCMSLLMRFVVGHMVLLLFVLQGGLGRAQGPPHSPHAVQPVPQPAGEWHMEMGSRQPKPPCSPVSTLQSPHSEAPWGWLHMEPLSRGPLPPSHPRSSRQHRDREAGNPGLHGFPWPFPTNPGSKLCLSAANQQHGTLFTMQHVLFVAWQRGP